MLRKSGIPDRSNRRCLIPLVPIPFMNSKGYVSVGSPKKRGQVWPREMFGKLRSFSFCPWLSWKGGTG